MDERQRQITEGAGLEESRINKEFIDFLQKWATPVLLVILLLSGGYAGLQYLERQRIERLDAAFLAYDAAELEGRPERLLEVAREYDGAGAVEEMALLAAADLYYTAYYTRREPGAQALPGEEGLSDEEAETMLARAGELYEEAHSKASSAPGRELLAVGALWGLASVDLTKQNFDAAEGRLRDVAERASEAGYPQLANQARGLLDRLPELRAQRAPVVVEAPAETPDAEPEAEPEVEPETSAEPPTSDQSEGAGGG